MKYKIGIIFIGLTFSLTSKLAAHNFTISDSLTICKTVSDFYGWYIDAIKQKKYSEFQPTFVETKNGMTTLNFTEYFNNLAKYEFSDSLIIKERVSYQQCIDELGKVKYSDFETNFTDLDDFENIECGFSNYYRWTGGQEPIDGIRIKTLRFNDSDSATVIIEYYDHNSEDNKQHYWGRNMVSLIKTKDIWKIDNISWK